MKLDKKTKKRIRKIKAEDEKRKQARIQRQVEKALGREIVRPLIRQDSLVSEEDKRKLRSNSNPSDQSG